jgi:hypothetical protein
MNDRVENVIERLNKVSDDYPNISNVWKTYIIKRKARFDELLNQCDTILTRLEKNTNEEDLELLTIMLMIHITNPSNLNR